MIFRTEWILLIGCKYVFPKNVKVEKSNLRMSLLYVSTSILFFYVNFDYSETGITDEGRERILEVS